MEKVIVDLRSEKAPDVCLVSLFLSFSPDFILIPLTANTYWAIANIATNMKLFLTTLAGMFLFRFIVQQK